MLYLIEDRDYLKIGYANNVEERMKTYRTHTLYTKLLDTKKGSKIDETRLHQLCEPYCIESEWFRNCPEVIAIWNNYSYYNQEEINEFKAFIQNRAEQLLEFHKKHLFGTCCIETVYYNNPTKLVKQILNNHTEDPEINKYKEYYYQQNRYFIELEEFCLDPKEVLIKFPLRFSIYDETSIEITKDNLKDAYCNKLKELTEEIQELCEKHNYLKKIESEHEACTAISARIQNEIYQVLWRYDECTKEFNKLQQILNRMLDALKLDTKQLFEELWNKSYEFNPVQ